MNRCRNCCRPERSEGVDPEFETNPFAGVGGPAAGLRGTAAAGRATALLFCALSIFATTAGAQDPSHQYFTIATTHFRVTFTAPLEPFARRVAVDAERAYAQLSAELHPPRGTVDILVTDDVDFSNGNATPVPSNRIVLYATPPVNELGLRFTTDWAQLVVTHELTHIFHLDRSRGIWRLAQYVFGRSPFLFPNLNSPSWLTEGLAVHEESKLAGEGRIEAPEHTMLARTAAANHRFPSIGQASLALPTFPRGNSAYAYGSLFIDWLARTRGDSAVHNFVESSSAQLIPYLIDLPAKKAFGTTFEHAWRDWENSVAAVAGEAKPSVGWRTLTDDGIEVSSPRWQGDTTVIYTGTNGKESYGAFTVSLDGRRRQLSRRNSASPTVNLPDGAPLFAQLELTSPYEERSDLFVQRGARQIRITTGARLFSPDIRADGTIIATQVVTGATRLVRVSSDGETITPITATSFDTLWSEPRWSAAGDRIVAVRWFRGGVSQVVVIDTLGRVLHIATSGRFTAAAPSWLANDRGIIYTVGDNARNDVYRQYFLGPADQRPADARTFPGPAYRVATFRVPRADFGVFEPQSAPTARDPHSLAAVGLGADGYHLEVAEHALTEVSEPATLDATPDPRLPALAIDTSPARPFSALRTLMPRYWAPLFESGIDASSFRVGGYTEGWDILRRHYIYTQLLIPSDNSGIDADIQYEYRGLGQPILSVNVSQDWAHFGTIQSTGTPAVRLGDIRRRIRDGEVLATFLRQRVRSAFTVSGGVGLERREYASVPESLLAKLTTAAQFAPADFPRLTLSSSYATYQSPPFSISPEDGFTLAATGRERLRSGFNATGAASTSIVAQATAYKSLDLPGYAHHVFAVRGSGGWGDARAGTFEIGGTSGGTYQIIPGYTVGEGRQTFPVRGFNSAALTGTRAASASAEYRAPLSLTQRSIGTLPTFLNRSSLTLFSDYGLGLCPCVITTPSGSSVPTQSRVSLASVGAELNLNAGVLSWDSPVRFRAGIALPVENGDATGSRRLTFYFTSGLSF